MALEGPRGFPPLLVRAVDPVAEDGVGAVVLVEIEEAKDQDFDLFMSDLVKSGIRLNAYHFLLR